MLGDGESDCTLLDCEFLGNKAFGSGGGGAVWAEGNTLTATRCVFAGNTGSDFGGGAIGSSAKVMRLSHCTFTGNTCRGELRGSALADVGAVSSSALVTQISNCTFAGNRGEPNAFEHRGVSNSRVALTQCIVWDGEEPFGGEVSVTYSNVQGGYAGDGNMELNPCFVDPGYWADPNDLTREIGSDDPNAVWMAGDYHLRSQAGRWDRAAESWVRDGVTSPCIDAGNPVNPLGVEPFPNGGCINMGAYGGTGEASKSYFGEPVCETQIPGDINGDCRVDQTDMDILQAHWLMEVAGLVNIPPTIALISPEDGAELTYPTPIVLQSVASDPDGTVLRVEYTLEYREANLRSMRGMTSTDPADNWRRVLSWSDVRYDGTYTVWAGALDNEGTRTISPKITVTLHPSP